MADVAAGRAFNGRAADNDVEDTSCCLLEDLDAAARDRAVRDCRRCEIDSMLYIK